MRLARLVQSTSARANTAIQNASFDGILAGVTLTLGVIFLVALHITTGA
jgi:hypothetical protein